jgi:glycosyltransferase involved in cell wall biosynthesis
MMNELNVFFQEHSLISYTGDLTKALSAMGVNVNLFTMRPKLKKLQKHGINVRYFPFSKVIWITPNEKGKKIIERYISYHWLLKKIRDLGIGVLHVNVASKAEMFLKTQEKYKIPMVYTNHYVPEPEPLETLDVKEFLVYEEEKLWIPRICEHSSEVVTVSKYAKKRLKEEFGIDSTVIYHGVDLNKFNPFLSNEKKNLGFENDNKIVLWVARFGNHPYKDPFTFIRAIPRVLQQYPKTKFVMIGRGLLKPYVVNLAKKLSVNKSIRFLDHVENLNHFYAISDVFVFPSFNDNFGLVVAEAMACGKPVIVSNRGAPQEIVGDAGLIFEYGCYEDLADKINMLLGNNDLSQKIGKKAYQRIKENFTWDKAARNYIHIYEKLS